MAIVIRGYFDDSGSDDESDLFMVGGLSGFEDVWSAIELEWEAKRTKWGIEYYKSSEARPPYWGQFEGWERTRVDACIWDFLPTICQTGIFAFSVGIRKRDLRAALPEFPDVVMRDVYWMLMFSVISRTAAFWNERAKHHESQHGNPVEFVQHFIFDDQDEVGLALEILKKIRHMFKFTGTVSHGPSKTVLPLQAADMAIGAIRRHKLKSDARPDATPNTVYRFLEDSMHTPKLFTPEEFRKMSAPLLGLDEHRS